ncbi:hypothetical protein, partial [Escherichia coli]|uniref:hypothetical protein n=1 Tax=Escherichia coli TaxID=562 RepID=UPI0024E04BE9
MGSCAAPSAKGDDKFITTDYLQQCPFAYLVSDFFISLWILGKNSSMKRHYQLRQYKMLVFSSVQGRIRVNTPL